ncbi:MAG: hypothetical protein IT366_15100 [Candidatus Hydrogenedentes bacterium]|nr:hypothetical protein [Candidatus Hydrogenedentota bacterium]
MRPVLLSTLGVVAIGAIVFANAAEPEKVLGKSTSQVENLTPIDIRLPGAFFGGTPLNYENEHFEGSIFAPRPPFLAPKGAMIISANKPVTSSAHGTVFGKFSMITDGEKGYENDYLTELGNGPQWIQIDLGQVSEIYAVIVWHFHQGDRVYFDFAVRTADDADFKINVTTLYNNDYDNSSGIGIGNDREYIEKAEGRLIPAFKEGKATVGRCVRLYSNGNTTDQANHYVEVEVWGKPISK